MNQPLQEDLDFLEHFGVKGQKWGVRKTKSSGRMTKKSSPEHTVITRAGQVATGAMLVALGGLSLAAIKMGH